MADWLNIFILAFACFRLTRLVVQDVIFEPLRAPFFTVIKEDGEEWIEPKGVIGELLSCQWCVGVWMALAVVFLHLFVPYSELFLLVMAVAGMQSLIYTWSERE
ncbi:DUF1360 domain-containing protein [Halobacillus sp. Marseille-Q1614]|uniref:DUF1360 domain-containing protein n=1 Tax=Halobacillus sp. Marseille-Q1614 TaxID=2709134 RepID=UPI00156FE900|nr:DUF1360 domain-containing protein [Halobacillus sp. Marseille-Q1614]